MAKKEEKPSWKPKPGTVIWPPKRMLSVDFLLGEDSALSKFYDWVSKTYGPEYVGACKKKFNNGLVQYITPKIWTVRHGIEGVPPLQPHILLIETSFPEPLYYDLLDILTGTSGLSWTMIKLKETLAISPTTQLHGTMLAKKSAQERDAQEALKLVQTVKTVVLNLEGDMEKLQEQKDAFEEERTSQIKSIFMDNYGGQGRTWTALARNVPLIQSAMQWFLRLQSDSEKGMMDEVDKVVEEGKLNPAVANYLRRKIQEYWGWRDNYSEYIQRTFRRISENLKQQKANLELYSKWAKEHIEAVDQMFVDINTLDIPTQDLMATEMPAWTPRAGTLTEFIVHDRSGQATQDLALPWVPVIAVRSIMTFNPDTPQHKFTRAVFFLGYGIIHDSDLTMVEGIISQKHEELGEFMAEHAGLTDVEIRKMFGKAYQEKAKQKKGFFDSTIDWWHEFNSHLLEDMDDMAAPFGIDFFELFNTRKKRAEWFAHNTFMVAYDNFKQALGLPIF